MPDLKLELPQFSYLVRGVVVHVSAYKRGHLWFWRLNDHFHETIATGAKGFSNRDKALVAGRLAREEYIEKTNKKIAERKERKSIQNYDPVAKQKGWAYARNPIKEGA